MRSLEAQPIELNEVAKNVALGLQRGTLEQLWLTCVAVCIDLPLVAVAFWFGFYASIPPDVFAPLLAGAAALLSATVFVASMIAVGGYKTTTIAERVSFLTRSALCLVLPLIVFLAVAPVESLSAAVIALGLSLGLAILPSRFGASMAMQWAIGAGLVARRAVIAGGGDEAGRLIRGLAGRQSNDIRLHGIFDDRDDKRSPVQVLGVPKIGGYDDLVAFVRASEIDLVIIALPFAAEKRIQWLLDEFKVLPVEVGLSAYSRDFAFESAERAPFIEGLRRSFAPECRFTKRLFDIFFAVFALSLLWPVLLGAAIAVRLESPGPILFRQRRHGYNNRPIEILKFRSMYHNMSDPAARQVVTKGDPRVTKVGRFIRRSSIDELPQLFNVLRGELSLVGPRPHAVDALSSKQEKFSQIVDGYSARHRLPPGITGWAQINGWRGEIDDAEKLQARVEHDLYYIENWSFWLDLKILFRTPLSLLNSKGAY